MVYCVVFFCLFPYSMPNRFLVILTLSLSLFSFYSFLFLSLTSSTLLSTLFSFHNKQSNKQRNAQQEQMFDISGFVFNILSPPLSSFLSCLAYLLLSSCLLSSSSFTFYLTNKAFLCSVVQYVLCFLFHYCLFLLPFLFLHSFLTRLRL